MDAKNIIPLMVIGILLALRPVIASVVGPVPPSAVSINFPAQLAAAGGVAGALVVQSTAADALAGNTNAKAFPQNNTAGNLIRITCSVFQSGGGQSLTSIVDTNLNSYTTYIASTNPGNVNFWMLEAYAKNISGGANTVTVTFNVGASGSACYFTEISGLSTTAPLEKSSSTAGGTAIAWGGNFAATANTKLITGSVVDDKDSSVVLYTPEANYIRWGIIADNQAGISHAFETYGTSNAIVNGTVYNSSWTIDTSNWLASEELWK